jgi:hypothetical protein
MQRNVSRTPARSRDWRMLAASVLFRVPIVREMTLWRVDD